MFKFSCTTKNCVSCAFFEGSRSLDSVWTPHNILTESQTQKGVCGHRHSPWWNQQKQANQVCQVWEIWPRLGSYK